MREFVPFDDRWFDAEPPGKLIPLPTNFVCLRDPDGTFHWVPEATPDNVITAPLRNPSFAAVPALTSST